MRRLRDKVVVVTGAGSGIGRATVKAFLEVGAVVHGADVREDYLQAVREELVWAGDRFSPHVVDVRDASAVARLAAQVYARRGRVDVLHNNAGVVVGGPVSRLSVADWRLAIDVNLLGVVNGIWAFVPRMIAQGGGGHVVNTASVAGLLGFPMVAPYSTSKFAVVGLSEALDAELSPHDIRVAALCPGMVRTGVTTHGKLSLPGGGVALLERAMAKWALDPEEVAAMVLRLVRRHQGGIHAVGLGTRPLWLLRRTSVAGYQAVMAALSRRVMKRSPGGDPALNGAAAPSNGLADTWGVLVVHPSRQARAEAAHEDLRARLSRERPGYAVWPLRSPPDLVLAYAARAPQGAQFQVVPLLAAPGSHYAEDVSQLAERIRQAQPHLEVVVRPPLLQDDGFMQWLLAQL